jgi:hypothetical protein
MISSILCFQRQKPRSTARRILLPYSVGTLFMNTAFASMKLAEEQFESSPFGIKASQSDWLPFSDTSGETLIHKVIKNLLLTLPIIVNDALFVSLFRFVITVVLNFHKMYRAGTLCGWNWRPLALPGCLYLITVGEITYWSIDVLYLMLLFQVSGISPNIYFGIKKDQRSLILFYNLFMGCTLALNVLLASMITRRLLLARRAALTMGTHMNGLASQYLTTVTIMVESAGVWILSIILYLACFNSFVRYNLHHFENFPTLVPFFSYLFEITSVSYKYSLNISDTDMFIGTQSRSSLVPHRTQYAIHSTSYG